MTAAAQAVSHPNSPCPGCGCLCDDLTIDIDESGRVLALEPACRLAAEFFQTANSAGLSPHRDGRPVSQAEAVQAAADILSAAKAPLLFGLGETTNETVRRVVDLADHVQCIVDATHPTWFDPAGRLLQTTGLVTTSLGEIRHRADLVLFWGADPLSTHPRHLERYSADPVGRFIPAGREDRYLVSLGANTTLANQVDEHLEVAEDRLIESLHVLNSLANGKSAESVSPQLQALHARIAAARYFVFVLGQGFLQRRFGRIPLELLATYIRRMHRGNRGAVSILRPGPNWVGAAGVVASRTAWPGRASLLTGQPTGDVENLRAAQLLAERRVDACLLFEGPWLDQLDPAAAAILTQLPQIILTHRPLARMPARGVVLPVARPGLECGGTISRMDDIPLPLRQLVAGPPSGSEIIQAILNSLPS